MRHSEPRRAPSALLLPVVLLALVLAGALVGWLAWQWTILQETAPWLAYAVRAAVFLLPLAGAVELGVIVWRNFADHRYIQAHHVAKLARAQRAIPDGVQNLHWHDSSRSQIVDQEEEETRLALPPPAPAVPTFAQLLDAGKIGPGRPLLLSYRSDDGQPIEGSWSKLYSTGIGGMTGSGKSWLAAFLLAQSVASSNARLIVVDPHAGDPESLAERISGLSTAFKCGVASTPTQIESALKLAATELSERIAGRPAQWPIILVCDEWTSLLRGRLGELLTTVALDYSEQGRKYGCFAMLAAQAWQVDAAGPVRDRLASHYAMRTRGDQFRYQLGLRGSAPLDTMFLKPGEAYFLSVTGDLAKVVIPQMTAADLARVGAMIDTPAAVSNQSFGFKPATAPLHPITATVQSEAGMKRLRSGNEAVAEAASMAAARPRSGAPLSPEAARVYAAWKSGRDVTDLAKEANGGSTSGDSYKQKLRQINALLREATGGQQ